MTARFWNYFSKLSFFAIALTLLFSALIPVTAYSGGSKPSKNRKPASQQELADSETVNSMIVSNYGEESELKALSRYQQLPKAAEKKDLKTNSMVTTQAPTAKANVTTLGLLGAISKNPSLAVSTESTKTESTKKAQSQAQTQSSDHSDNSNLENSNILNELDQIFTNKARIPSSR